MKDFRRLTFLFMLAVTSLPAAAALHASLDRDQVAPGESVELTLQRDGRSDNPPDLTPLQQDFAILGRASGTSLQIVNGHMNAQVQLRLTLSPKHSGRIVLPSLNWDVERSPALVLTVAGNSAGTGNSAADRSANAPSSHVFITSTLTQKQPYVQAGTPLKLRLYTDQPLYQASLDLPASNDVLVQQIGKDKQGSEMRGGHRYQVIERDYLLFPQHSGRISFAGPVLEAQVADNRSADAFGNDPFFSNPFGNAFGNFPGHNPFAGMMNATRPMRLQGDAIVLDVRPRPADASGQDWLPAGQLSLQESWHPDTGELHAGEPLTRHLRLSALGLTAAQLPDLADRMPLPEGIKAYPDQAKLNNETQDENVVGTREQDIALIASQPGRYTLPAIHLTWWDTTRNSPREVVIPARTLEILPGAAGSGTSTPLLPENTPGNTAAVSSTPSSPLALALPGGKALPWFWISLALGLLWLATLTAWWRARRATPVANSTAPAVVTDVDTVGAREARKAFRLACLSNAAPAARQHLLAWARAEWPHDPPVGLNAIGRRLPDPGLPILLRELDRACYVGGEWRGEPLAAALSALPAASKNSGEKPAQLVSLYP